MNLRHIKNYLRSRVNSNIIVIYRGSRNRKERFNGVLYKLYENVFIIKLDNSDIKCFSYVDILTKTVQICI